MQILGRSDDVINVAGHRLGTREIEETVSSHPAVAEVATVGASDPVKGQAVHCFVVLKNADAFATPEDQASLKSEIESVVAAATGRILPSIRDLSGTCVTENPIRKNLCAGRFSPQQSAATRAISAHWKIHWRWMQSKI
jgi:acyl-CoA synthetase (AMP-forming)/AMP-acid ligase II